MPSGRYRPLRDIGALLRFPASPGRERRLVIDSGVIIEDLRSLIEMRPAASVEGRGCPCSFAIDHP